MNNHKIPVAPPPSDEMKHSFFEDALAIVHATLFIALGITL